jgi:hypothetical protein
LSDDEQRLKQQMIAAHRSQCETLAAFRTDRETFRSAPPCDFGQLPNGGMLLYERYDWGLSGEQWRELADSARVNLGLEWPM